MKIEKICCKEDLITNLKRAVKYSKLTHLSHLANFVQEQVDLQDLKENLCIECYDLRLIEGEYQIVKQTCQYTLPQCQWQVKKEEIIKVITLEEVEKAYS